MNNLKRELAPISTAAWNAFLKTLEEPPPHTIFVLATTEANKVLPTVVDRCHRFDFGRPTVTQIASVLRRVADTEEIWIPDEACALIARNWPSSWPRSSRAMSSWLPSSIGLVVRPVSFST